MEGKDKTSAAGSNAVSMDDISASSSSAPTAKKIRTNIPWTPSEEQRLKIMRDAGNSWAEISKVRALLGLPERGALHCTNICPHVASYSPKELKEASKNIGIR